MAEKQLPAPAKQANKRVLDFDTSAVLIAERLIGEILGWDLVDWAAVDPHKGRRFFFGRQWRSDPSIHSQLKPLFDRCDIDKNDFSALKPSPVVNANLSKLVGCVCRHVGRHELSTAESDDRVLERTIEQDHLHLAVTKRMLDRIETDTSLSGRAGQLKRIAAAAESELERHFTDLINERLESSFIPNGSLDPYKIKGLRDQAKSRIEETQALNERELVGLAMPELALDEDALVRIEMAKILLSRFPYVRNYELMLYAELAMLQQPLTPRFARERMLSVKFGKIDHAAIERLDVGRAGLSSLMGEAEPNLWGGGVTGRRIAICGSGPLPMTGLFLHLLTGANIVLVDEDRAAIDRSKRLIANLERLNILEPCALAVVQEDAGRLRFLGSDKSGRSSEVTSLSCDAVIIASLVDRDAKASIAAQFSSDLCAPALLIMRSATGLSAKLAYDPVPTETLSRRQLAYCGETLPATQVATHLDRAEAARRGVACLASPDVLAIAHPDVVNTTEIYKKMPAAPVAFDLKFDRYETIDDWLQALEQAGAKDGAA